MSFVLLIQITLINDTGIKTLDLLIFGLLCLFFILAFAGQFDPICQLTVFDPCVHLVKNIFLLAALRIVCAYSVLSNKIGWECAGCKLNILFPQK